jgi:radical SAM superfamily enzyme YgiQ (UPF0313 family)
MRVTMILPALTEAKSPLFRPIKYSLFSPLGLATLAGYLSQDDEVTIEDEHVQRLDLDDEPDLPVIQAYITSARRSYEIADHYRARGVYVAMGGLHVTSLPDEAQLHADTVFLGPGEDTWPRFLRDFRAGRAEPRYTSRERTLVDLPPIRRDLIQRHRYLVPNSIVVSRGCPHVCDFCYKVALTLEEGYWRAYREFYGWRSIWQAAATKENPRERARHIAYAAGWKKFEPLWDVVIRTGQVLHALPILELVLNNTPRPKMLGAETQ